MSCVRIDSHQHFWQPARGDYGWLDAANPAVAPLVRDVLPADFAPIRQRHGIAASVLVQAAPSVAETDWLLGLAQADASIAAVVGWVDLSRPESADTLQRWAATQPKLRSVRPMLQDLPDDDWIAHAPHPAVVQAMREAGLRFDALVKPQHLAGLRRFVERWPDLPVVIDHAAKPQLAEGWQAAWVAPWRKHLAALAQAPQVVAKFSGILTEHRPAAVATEADALAAVQPVWDALLGGFGPDRVMWGSDWPVLTLAADYDRWVAVSQRLIGSLPAADQQAVWAGTAARFYGLDGASTKAPADPAPDIAR